MGISGSVGKGGRNSGSDTRQVQALLNPHVGIIGVQPLDVDGACGPLTIAAITRYQSIVMKVAVPDGRVDPGGKTIISLTNAPATADAVITAARKIAKLTAADFKKKITVTDPADNTEQDAYTAFNYDLPSMQPRILSGQYAMGAPNVIAIEPEASVRIGVALTAGLLAHEQFHYDVGFVVARTLAHQLTILRAPSFAALKASFLSLSDLHFGRRVKLIQRRYDIDTAHGTNASYQRIWLDRMTACLANPAANQIGGFWL